MRHVLLALVGLASVTAAEAAEGPQARVWHFLQTNWVYFAIGGAGLLLFAACLGAQCLWRQYRWGTGPPEPYEPDYVQLEIADALAGALCVPPPRPSPGSGAPPPLLAPVTALVRLVARHDPSMSRRLRFMSFDERRLTGLALAAQLKVQRYPWAFEDPAHPALLAMEERWLQDLADGALTQGFLGDVAYALVQVEKVRAARYVQV